MSSQDIGLGVPNPFVLHPTTRSLVTTVFDQNIIDSTSTLGVGQLTGGLIVTNSNSNITLTLPESTHLLNALGNNPVDTVYIIPVYNINSGNSAFIAGTGGSGSKTIIGFASGAIYITVTDLTSTPPTYTLS